MDNSHVALSSVELRTDAFTLFRCDRPMSIGVKLDSLQKIVRTAGNEDVVTLKKDDDGDNLNLVFEATSEFSKTCLAEVGRQSRAAIQLANEARC